MAYQVIKGKICNTGDKSDIPLLTDAQNKGGISYDKGFGSITSQDKLQGGIPPDRDTLNQFLYITSANLYAFQNGEFPTFNANVLQYLDGGIGYETGAVLYCEAEGRFVKSTIDNNNNNFITTPSVIGTSWVFLNDDEVSNISTGLTLSNSASSITVASGFTKSLTSGRILKLSSNLTNTWNDIQSNSSLTPTANTSYNLYLSFNPSTRGYLILAGANNTLVPTLPSGYTDYALLGYMNTDGNIGVNYTYPSIDINDWYLLGKQYSPDLLETKWTDHLINDMSWLRADTFSWQDGTVYSAAYNELLSEYNNASSTTETEGSITFKRTPKGYKIANADEESDILSLYNSTGVAWYYIIDTSNHRFKLPRTKWGFVGYRNAVGDYVAESLPNITGNFGCDDNSLDPIGCFYHSTGSQCNVAGTGNSTNKISIDASRSSSAYQNGAPVQQRATQMYLYFYAGNYTQTAVEQTAGLNASLFSAKADIDLNNVSNTSGFRKLIEIYNNGTDWYKVYAEYNPSTGAFIGNWCEQGGQITGSNQDVTFLKSFANTNYHINIQQITVGSTSASYFGSMKITDLQTTYFHYMVGQNENPNVRWKAEGYIS